VNVDRRSFLLGALGLGACSSSRGAPDGALLDAHVLEASQRAGGVVGTSHVDGFVREHAASSFLGGPPNGALALCEQLGLSVEKASPQAKMATGGPQAEHARDLYRDNESLLRKTLRRNYELRTLVDLDNPARGELRYRTFLVS